jgi:tRNA (cmo5U34)-methyltransferase
MTNSPYHGTDRKKLEPMADFFTARLAGYEEHMLRETSEHYQRFAKLVPPTTQTLLDLGCGTGLELDYIFKKLPDVSVTGIDLTQAMLDKLKQKHPKKKLKLICGNYFEANLGKNIFDTVISCATLHHFLREPKTSLYKKVFTALKTHGRYIENDYMVDERRRNEFQAENIKLRREQNIPDGEFYHFDIPYTVENQVDMLKEAGFSRIDVTGRSENGATLIAYKQKDGRPF